MYLQSYQRKILHVCAVGKSEECDPAITHLFALSLICVGTSFQEHNTFKASAKMLYEKSIQYQNICKRPKLYWSIHPKHLKTPRWGGKWTKYWPWTFLAKIMFRKWGSLMYWLTACPLHCWLRESTFKFDLLFKPADGSHVLYLFF